MIDRIRNFAIIAHIDHGKTTLTDQLLKRTGTIPPEEEGERILDSNPIEKERGITIKLAPVRMEHKIPKDLQKTLHFEFCTLNLIDTPGHVDFSYEVSRSLAACEGALLLIDATQGIEAQTLAHAREVLDLGLTLIPAVNKIDLQSARIEETQYQLSKVFGFKEKEMSLISAKTGEGVDDLLMRLVTELPHPKGDKDAPLRALVFNSIYDTHLGVIAFIRVLDGSIESGQKLHLAMADKDIEPKEIGIFAPMRSAKRDLTSGEVGYVATGVKDIRIVKVGDTLTSLYEKDQITPLPGFRVPKPVVFADVYPSQQHDFNELKKALEKLKLTDAALSMKQTHSPSLGTGFRLGFLGLFHSEIARERLIREHGVESILAQPTVRHRIKKKNGEEKEVEHASELPEPSQIETVLEPMVEVTIISPRTYLGALMQLLKERRGVYRNTHYFGEQTQIIYNLPLTELITGFIDELKSASQGFASLDYKHIAPMPVDAVKLTILVNHDEVAALSRIVVRESAQAVGKKLVLRIKELLPRQLFAVPIQAAIGGKVIARQTKPAARKDVTAKLYGGDRTRRMKLLEKQKKGKKKLSRLGKVNIPPETFMKLMKT